MTGTANAIMLMKATADFPTSCTPSFNHGLTLDLEREGENFYQN
jgi:hypothetical protein